MLLAFAQLNSTSDLEKNLLRIQRLIQRASQNKASALLLPENALYMGPPEQLRAVALKIKKDQVLNRLQEAAAKNRIALLLGSYPELRLQDRRVYNTSLFWSEQGNLLGTYRKIHLFNVRTPGGGVYRENVHVAKGRKAVLVHWKGIRFGLSICFDLRFPEFYRQLSSMGADVLLIPSAFTYETGEAHWHALLRARAIENLAYVLAPAQTGTHVPKRRTYGHALAVDPWGKVLADAGTSPGLTFVRIDKARVRGLRKRFPVLLTTHLVSAYRASHGRKH